MEPLPHRRNDDCISMAMQSPDEAGSDAATVSLTHGGDVAFKDTPTLLTGSFVEFCILGFHCCVCHGLSFYSRAIHYSSQDTERKDFPFKSGNGNFWRVYLSRERERERTVQIMQVKSREKKRRERRF